MELKPCPFCGGEARFCDELQDSRGGATEFDVYCERCDLSTPGGHTHATAEEAVAAWNTRPTADLGDDGELAYHAEQLATYLAQPTISDKDLASARWHNHKLRAALKASALLSRSGDD